MGKGKIPQLLRKALTVFMTFVFFYLVIGDLITYHQKAIFDYDIFAGQPFNKPHKSENIFKVKDKKVKVQLSLLTFVSSLSLLNVNPFFDFIGDVCCLTFSLLIDNYQHTSITYRGPPALL